MCEYKEGMDVLLLNLQLVGWYTRSASLTHAGLLFGVLAGCWCVNRDLSENVLTTLPAGVFADLTNLYYLYV